MAEPSVLGRHDGLVALDKPAGWVTHAARPEERHDLRAWAHAHVDRRLEPVHRLDRETSGVVLFAADPAVRARLGEAFQRGEVHKSYLALVIGHAHRKGVIRHPLHPDHPGPPEPAVTRYALREALGGFSLLEVRPETGRKHQIRRHLQQIGLPLVGDARYPGRRRVRVPAFPGRLWLHALRVEVPGGAAFESPLPGELERTLAALREGTRVATA